MIGLRRMRRKFADRDRIHPFLAKMKMEDGMKRNISNSKGEEAKEEVGGRGGPSFLLALTMVST